MRLLTLTAIAISIALIGGCNSNDDENSTTTPEVKYGVFVDSPVEGLDFETETRSGTTDVNGTFEYLEGESIVFSLGGTVFPTVTGSNEITPMTLYGTDDASTPSVLNTLMLLQSLDSDGDPENGIEISKEMKNSLASIDLDPMAESFKKDAFAALAELGVDLISSDQALNHFIDGKPYQDADLIGKWFSITATLPVRTSQSPIDVMDNDYSLSITDREGYKVDISRESENVIDSTPMWLSINTDGGILVKEAENEVAILTAAMLNARKNAITYVSLDGDDDGDPESEFGLMIKLADEYQQSDLTGEWYSFGMELPKKGQAGQPDLPMVYVDKLVVNSEGLATLTEFSVANPESDELKVSVNADGNITIVDRVVVGSEQDQNNDGWPDEVPKQWAYLGNTKDVLLLADDDTTEWGFVIVLKQSPQSQLSDYAGTWLLNSVELPQEGNLDANKFAFHTDKLVIDAEGNVKGDHISDTGEMGEGVWTAKVGLNEDGLLIEVNEIAAVDEFDYCAINLRHDLFVCAYNNMQDGVEVEQGFAIGVKVLSAE